MQNLMPEDAPLVNGVGADIPEKKVEKEVIDGRELTININFNPEDGH